MSKVTCNVIRDLLPLYADDVISEDTRVLVREHLDSCESCQKELAKMKEPVILPDFQKAQMRDAEVIKNFRHELTKKRMLRSLLAILLVLVFVGGIVLAFGFYGRERTLAEILPMDRGTEITYASLSVPGSGEIIPLSPDRIEELFALMDGMHYKKLQTANGMDCNVNYATLRYTADGRLIELMFSSSKGGSVLVNDVDKDGASPLYRIISGGSEVERLLQSFSAP